MFNEKGKWEDARPLLEGVESLQVLYGTDGVQPGLAPDPHGADHVADRPAREVAVLHCRADELPVAGWRDDIYVRERLTERFTLLHAPAPGAVQAIHLYRDERQGLFQPDEIDRLLGLAPLLRQAHQAGSPA